MKVSVVLFALFVGAFLAVAALAAWVWWYFDSTRTTWEGDRTFQVTEMPESQDSFATFGVESTDETPRGADNGTPSPLSGNVKPHDMPAGVAVGDHVVCHVVERYRINTDIAMGPHSHVTTCHH